MGAVSTALDEATPSARGMSLRALFRPLLSFCEEMRSLCLYTSRQHQYNSIEAHSLNHNDSFCIRCMEV